VSKIVLTTDASNMSELHQNIYLGFLSCLPKNVCPEPMYKALVPPVDINPDGSARLPTLPLRAVEAICVNAGHDPKDVKVAHPLCPERVIGKDTKIVGISTHDPLGLGPATSTWASILNGIPHNRLKFLDLMRRVRSLKEKYGFTDVELLESLGFLKSDVLAAHCIYLSEEEMRVMAKRDVKVSYNPVANMKIALGVPKIRDLMGLGVTVGIGTDGPASNNDLDMFDDMRVAALLQKVSYMDSTVLPVHSVLGMATIDGARALGLEGSVGSLEVGKKADVILVDFGKPHLTPVHDFYANVVYSARGSDVDTVIVDGKILMEGGEVRTLDEEEVRMKAKESALDLLAR